MPVSSASVPARAAYLRGQAAYDQLRNVDAHSAFSEAARLDPNFAIAYYGMAVSAPTREESRADLAKAAKALVAGRASEAEVNIIKGTEAWSASKGDVAFSLLSKVAKAFPNDPHAHAELGSLYISALQWGNAIDEYRKAIALDPQAARPYLQLAYALRTVGKVDEAEQMYKKCIQLAPKAPAPYSGYGDLLMKAGRFAESIGCFEKVLALDPKGVNAYLGVANNQIFMGHAKLALQALAKLEATATTDAERREACFWEAVAYVDQGDTKAAVEAVQRMLNAAKHEGDPVMVGGDTNLMGMILLEAGQPDAALAKFTEAVQVVQSSSAPDSIKERVARNQLYDLARVELAKHDVTGAADDAAKYRVEVTALKLPFELSQSHELDGLVALAKGDAATAVKELELANQQNPCVLFALGEAYTAAGNAASAKDAFTRAANFNVPGLDFALVRTKALAKLKG
jgi:tetratricopeptide (TPR) repeat protein